MTLAIVGCCSSGDETNPFANTDDTYSHIYPDNDDNNISGLVLFGATHFSAHASNTSYLYVVNTTNGSTTLIGDIGFRVNGMAYDSVTKKLYGTTSDKDPIFHNGLIEINMQTGAGSPIGTANSKYINVPTFNSSGELFAWSESNDHLITINITTGAIATNFPHYIGTAEEGLSFNNSDVLYLVNDDANVYIMDPTTGQGTNVGHINNLPNSMAHHGDFHPETGKYWGLDTTNYYTTSRKLLVIDIDTLTLEQTIPTMDSLHMLAFGYR
jgi:DNA-binding beta-propeller fold protein YncE